MAETDKIKLDLTNTVAYLRSAWGKINPEVAIICGSGWGEISEIFQNSLSINYSDIPGFSSTTIEGHEGILSLCEINQKQIFFPEKSEYFTSLDELKDKVKIVLVLKRLGHVN